MLRRVSHHLMKFSGSAAPKKPRFYLNPHEEPVAFGAQYTPYPLPKHDETFGYGPTRVDFLPDVPTPEEQLQLTAVEGDRFIEGTPEREDASTSYFSHSITTKSATIPSPTLTLDENQHRPIVNGQVDKRLPALRRDDVSSEQVEVYVTTKSPEELLRELKHNSVRHHLQNEESVLLRANIASSLRSFSNHDIAEVLDTLCKCSRKVFEPMRTTKVRQRDTVPHAIPNDIVLSSHASLMREIELELVQGRDMRALNQEPSFLSSVLRSYAHLRPDDNLTALREVFEEYDVYQNTLQANFKFPEASGRELFQMASALLGANTHVWPAEVVLDYFSSIMMMWHLTEDYAPVDAVIGRFMDLHAKGELEPELLVRLWMVVSLVGVHNEALSEAAKAVAQTPAGACVEALLALGSNLPVDVDALIRVWRILPPRDVGSQRAYRMLFDVLKRIPEEADQLRVIKETVGSVEQLDSVLVSGLGYFTQGFPSGFRLYPGMTTPEMVNFAKSSQSRIEIVDESLFTGGRDSVFNRLTAQMKKQSGGQIGLGLHFSTVLELHQNGLRRPQRDALAALGHEYANRNIFFFLPSDELAMARGIGHTDEVIRPLVTALWMTRVMPLVEPAIVTRRYEHKKRLYSHLLSSSGLLIDGGRNTFQSLQIRDRIKQVVRYIRATGPVRDGKLETYNDYVDRKLSAVLRNERRYYSMRRSLGREYVSERTGHHLFGTADYRDAGIPSGFERKQL